MNKKKISNCVEHKDDINQQVQPTHTSNNALNACEIIKLPLIKKLVWVPKIQALKNPTLLEYPPYTMEP